MKIMVLSDDHVHVYTVLPGFLRDRKIDLENSIGYYFLADDLELGVVLFKKGTVLTVHLGDL